MKILFVTPEIPHKFGGGAIRMYYQLKYLKNYDIKVDIISFYRTEKEILEIKNFVNEIFTIQEKNKNYFEKIKNLLLLKAYDKNFDFLNLFKEVLSKNKYDLIHIHKFQMAEYFMDIFDIPIIIDLWACGLGGVLNEFKYEKNLFEKFIILSRIPRFYIADKRYYNNFNNFFVVSEKAKEYILKRYPQKKVYIIPNGVDLNEFTYKHNFSQKNIIFTGDMSFFQNADTVLYFVEKIYPLVKAKIPDVKFYIVGKNPTNEILNLAKKDNSIIVTGFVENIYEYLNNSSIFVAPIRSGAGIRNKILEALACGLPVIATKNACEGIEVTDGKDIIIAEKPIEFAQKIEWLFNNNEKMIEIGKNARKLIEEKYQWKNIVKNMISYYREIIQIK